MVQKRFKEKKYMAHGASICPYCTASNITNDGPVEMNGMGGYQLVLCLNCGSCWHDILRVVGSEPVHNNT